MTYFSAFHFCEGSSRQGKTHVLGWDGSKWAVKQWHCPNCRREWKTEDDAVAHFHRCKPRRNVNQRRAAIPEYEGLTLEEVWLSAFAGFRGGIESPTTEEARAETGETGRRKTGSGEKR